MDITELLDQWRFRQQIALLIKIEEIFSQNRCRIP